MSNESEFDAKPQDPPSRYIWIIRHGKSMQQASHGGDHARLLNDRGHKDGEHMSAWYQKQSLAAQWIWLSSALRAQETGQYVAAGFPNATCVDAPELYLASPETLLDQIQATPETTTTVAVVAHNPGLTQLLNLLVGRQVIDNLPTFGSALVRCDTTHWSELAFGGHTCLELMTPKSIR